MRLHARALKNDIGKPWRDVVTSLPRAEGDPLRPNAQQHRAAPRKTALRTQDAMRGCHGNGAIGLDRGDFAENTCGQTHKLQGKGRGGPVIQGLWRIQLFDPTLVHYRDPVRHDQCLILIMRHENRGGAKFTQ